jgi:signal-transduction protein with cAMP-binding, CBS, and nucleotidyltransferase domain
MLPPRLQDQLVNTTLEKHIELLKLFFIDYESGLTTDKALVRRLVTALQFTSFSFGEHIIKKGSHALGVVFIQTHGVTVLGCNQTIRLLDFYDGSWCGEFESIFRQPAERSFIAVNKQSNTTLSTMVYFCKPDDFNEILSDFDDFDKFVRTRAIRRKAYIRYLEEEFNKELSLVEKPVA